MADLLMVPISGVWGNWSTLVAVSGVHFPRPMFELGQELFSKNPWPEEKQLVLHVSDGGCSSTTVKRLMRNLDEDFEPVHPAHLLSVAARMRWKKEWQDRVRWIFEYPLAVSPYLLAGEGNNYTLTIERDEKHSRFNGKFIDLSAGDNLPRCMQVYSHLPNSWRLNKYPYVFKPGENGMYENYVSKL